MINAVDGCEHVMTLS